MTEEYVFQCLDLVILKRWQWQDFKFSSLLNDTQLTGIGASSTGIFSWVSLSPRLCRGSHCHASQAFLFQLQRVPIFTSLLHLFDLPSPDVLDPVPSTTLLRGISVQIVVTSNPDLGYMIPAFGLWSLEMCRSTPFTSVLGRLRDFLFNDRDTGFGRCV